MSMDEITAYLMTGALDVPDDELDVYKHLKALPLPPDAPVDDEIPEPVVEPVNAKATAILQAAVKATEILQAAGAPVIIDEAQNIPTATIEALKDRVTIEEFVFAHKVPSLQTVMPQKSLGRPDKHDVSNLNLGEYVIYQGTLLSSARVMASLKGKSYEGERKFKAVEENGEIRIVRTK
jgi:hypothetical protein